MAPGYQLAVYALLIMTASMAGGLAPAMMRFSHRKLHLLMSLVAGLMLGVGVFHMLPHAAIELKSVDVAVRWLMGGLLGMFFLMRASTRIARTKRGGRSGNGIGTCSRTLWARS